MQARIRSTEGGTRSGPSFFKDSAFKSRTPSGAVAGVWLLPMVAGGALGWLAILYMIWGLFR